VRYDYFLTKDKADEGEQNMGYIRYLLQNMQGAAMNFDPIHDKESGFSFLTSVSYAFHPLLNTSYRFSTGFRVPNTEEKYFQFYSLWPSFVVLSNRGLKAEKSFNHEVELNGRGKGFGYLLSLYYNQYSDFIELKQGTLTIEEPLMQRSKSISYAKNVNQSSAHLMGFDAALQVYPGEWIDRLQGFMLSSAFSYAEGESSSGMSMLGIQPLTGNVGIEYTSPNGRWQANVKANLFFAKPVSQTTFWDKDAAGKELIRRYPASFMSNAYTFDVYGYYKLTRNLTLRAGIYNLLNNEYLRWDDLRQLTNPALLSNINYFFQDGKKSLSRFTRPKRYISIALEYKL
jgi:hemoglobin-haptoglobin utilization protein B